MKTVKPVKTNMETHGSPISRMKGAGALKVAIAHAFPNLSDKEVGELMNFLLKEIAKFIKAGYHPALEKSSSAPGFLADIPQEVLDEFKNVKLLPPVSKRTKASRDILKSMREVMREDG